MARRKSNSDFDKIEEPNLLPVMNIMFLLIPALLLSMEVATMAAIPVVPPMQSAVAPPSEEKPEEKDKALNLKVFIMADGFRVSAAEQQEGADAGREADSQRPTIPLSNPSANLAWEKYDYAALEAKAKEYKLAHSKETSVTFSAENNVPMQVLVSAMDAMRGRTCKEAYTGTGELPTDCYFVHAIVQAGAG